MWLSSDRGLDLTHFSGTRYRMGRPKGAKNIRTRVREAEAALGVSAPDLDSLHVLEQIMAYFYLRGMALKSKGGKPELIAANLRHAAAIAQKVAPYRHPRMGSMKLASDPNDTDKIGDDVIADELRAEVMARLAELIETGVIDLQALPFPANGIANGGQHEAPQHRRRHRH
jgi:hypothetical protein